MHDARIASALKRIISNTSFRSRVSVEEQRAQKYNRFLRGRQIASVATFTQPELMMQLKVYQICSMFACRMTMSKISSIQDDGTRSY